MAKDKGSIQLKLTPEQQEEIRKAIGRSAETLQLDIEELEERIAPSFKFR